MAFYGSSWQDGPETGRSIVENNIFYQCGSIEHCTHVPGPVAQSRSESEYNAACASGIALAHFRTLIHELLNKDPDIVPGEAPIIILYSNYAVCIYKNGKDANHTRHISRRVHFVRNGEKCKMDLFDWCEGGPQFVDIGTKNVGENDLSTKMKYHIKDWQLIENTCTIWVTGYRILCGTKVMCD